MRLYLIDNLPLITMKYIGISHYLVLNFVSVSDFQSCRRHPSQHTHTFQENMDILTRNSVLSIYLFKISKTWFKI